MDRLTNDVLQGAPRSRALRLAACLAAAALSLWLRTGFPVHAIPDAAADDGLFAALARQLLSGHWLGPFNTVTLAKGIGYPLFIAGAFAAGVPLKIAEQAFCLFVAALSAWVVRSCVPRARWLATAMFCALALDPIMYTDSLARVIREGMYGSLSLAVVVCSVFATFGRGEGSRFGWAGAAGGVLAGLAGAWFWLTREEGVWLVPAIMSIVVLAMLARIHVWHIAARPTSFAGAMAGLVVPWMTALLTMLMLVGTVAEINRTYYGVFEINEVKSLQFRRAYGALARIRSDHRPRYVVFPRDARVAAYGVSPMARELEPTLDGPVGEQWRKTGCDAMGWTACPEILGGWFQWALRDAAAAAGHYSTAATAAAYYRHLADEIDTECENGRLQCLPKRAALAPPFRPEYLVESLQRVPRIAALLVRPADDGIGVEPSQGSAAMIADFGTLVGPTAAAADQAVTAEGWANAVSGPPALQLVTAAGLPVSGGVALRPAPDVEAHFTGRRAVHFSLQTTCLSCVLQVGAPSGGTPSHIPVVQLYAGPLPAPAGVGLFVNDSSLSAARLTAVRQAIVWGAAKGVARIYQLLLTPFCLLACCGVAAGMVRWRVVSVPLLTLALASGIAVATRIALLAYLDVTAIPSVNVLYASPAEPFLIVFAATGCWIAARAVVPAQGWRMLANRLRRPPAAAEL